MRTMRPEKKQNQRKEKHADAWTEASDDALQACPRELASGSNTLRTQYPSGIFPKILVSQGQI